MHSFPVLLTLAVLNVAHTAPLPQLDRKPIANSTIRRHRSDIATGENIGHEFGKPSVVISRALVKVCINLDGTPTTIPNGEDCDGKTKYLNSDDPILHPNPSPSVGNPLSVKIKGSILGIPVGTDNGHDKSDPTVAPPNPPSSTGHDGGDGGFLGGIGPQFLGLGGLHDTGSGANTGSSSNSGSQSSANSNSNADSRDGRDGRDGALGASLIFGPGSKTSPRPSGDKSGDGNDGDDPFNLGAPVFAGEYGPGGEQPHNALGGDQGHNGPGGENRGHPGADGGEWHGQDTLDGLDGDDEGHDRPDGHDHDGADHDHDHDHDGADGGDHGNDILDGLDGDDEGHDRPDGNDHDQDGADGGDPGNDAPDGGDHGQHGYEGNDHGHDGAHSGDHGNHGTDGGQGSDHGHDGAHDNNHGNRGTEGADRGQDGYEGVHGSDHGSDGANGGDHGPGRPDGGDHGKDGYQESDGGDHGHDRPKGSDHRLERPNDGDRGRDGRGSDINPEDCDKDNVGDRSQGSHAVTGHSLGGPGPAQLPHGRNGHEASPEFHPRPHLWSPKPKSSPHAPKHRHPLHDYKDKSHMQFHHHFASHSQSPPSSVKWVHDEPECGCEQ